MSSGVVITREEKERLLVLAQEGREVERMVYMATLIARRERISVPQVLLRTADNLGYGLIHRLAMGGAKGARPLSCPSLSTR